jgi:hypothetical protein
VAKFVKVAEVFAADHGVSVSAVADPLKEFTRLTIILRNTLTVEVLKAEICASG